MILTQAEEEKILLTLTKSIQERDIVTYSHSRRVAIYAQRLARYLGWDRQQAHHLAMAAMVHDLGKTWIANEILNKSAALSIEERRTMERHPVIGARILIGYEISHFFVEAVLYHHERWSGLGYPAGLHGDEIPLAARILSIADVYDVLTSQRPYKAPMTIIEARERILLDSGSSFDPALAQDFVYLIDQHHHFTVDQPVRRVSYPQKTG